MHITAIFTLGLTRLDINTFLSISDDYEQEEEETELEDNSELTDAYRSINLNDVSPKTKVVPKTSYRNDYKSDVPKNSYQKIVLKEFPTTKLTSDYETTPTYELSEEREKGLKPPTPPFTTIWPDIENQSSKYYRDLYSLRV